MTRSTNYVNFSIIQMVRKTKQWFFKPQLRISKHCDWFLEESYIITDNFKKNI